MMIEATDLTTPEVREKYVLPLLREIVKKSSLSGVGNVDDVVPPFASDPSAASNVGATTLFQEIAIYDAHSRRKGDTLSTNGGTPITRTYAEVSCLFLRM